MFGGGSMSTALIGAGGGDEEVGSTVELVSSDSLGSLNAEDEEEEEVDLTVVGVEWDSEANVFEKIIFIIEFPFSVLRAVSIPSADRRWDWRHRLLAAISPIGCVMIVFLDFSPNWNLNPASGQATPWNGFAQVRTKRRRFSSSSFLLRAADVSCSRNTSFFLSPRWCSRSPRRRATPRSSSSHSPSRLSPRL